MNLARGTALLRLVKYVSGDNQRAARLDAERPLLQQRKAPGLWQVAVRLVAVDDVQAAPVPRARKIKIVAQEPTTWAVITRRGRPTEQAIERAETAIMDTIARSQWFATGPATLRIHAPTSVLPFAGSFEVAVPVFSHAQDQSTGDGSRPLVPDMPHQPSGQPAKPTGSLIGRGPGINVGTGSPAGLRSATVEQVSPPAVAQWWSGVASAAQSRSRRAARCTHPPPDVHAPEVWRGYHPAAACRRYRRSPAAAAG